MNLYEVNILFYYYYLIIIDSCSSLTIAFIEFGLSSRVSWYVRHSNKTCGIAVKGVLQETQRYLIDLLNSES